ncbi:stage III sporulation protein AF [Marinisporobacter balticus]|uniref:Stage III sporulation protein AF n=1 Tax=Marinisporobacter balticus TaxID=2018667 RepID=A0A4R2L1V8_9FIRM|nr:stage III sporulation protein AF [Marinisporobacter balticus]TCO79187.1 stage III sporulation protein AF [Marinisporobacter balticus]
MGMIAFMRSWILNIVTVIIFIQFLELLLPNSHMKKYINMVIGLLVMLVIINPMLALVKGDVCIEEEIFKTSSAIDKKTLSFDIDQFEGIQEKQMIALYKEKIKKHVKQQIEYNNKVDVLSVQCEIEESKDSKTFGNIKYLDIKLSGFVNDQTADKDIEPVSNIVIQINKGQKQENTNKKNDENKPMIKQIKENLSSFYELDIENICVNMHK